MEARETTVDDGVHARHRRSPIVIREHGKAHMASALVTDLPAATAWFPVYAAKRWAAGQLGKSGVAIPMDVFDPNHVLAEIRQQADGEMFILNGL